MAKLTSIIKKIKVSRKVNKVNCRVHKTPAADVSKVMSFPSDNFKYRNEYFHNVSPKVLYQEYIASASLNKDPKTSFQVAMKWTIVIGQAFGVLPVIGICGTDAYKVRFSYYSARCLYSVVSIFGQATLIFLFILKMIIESHNKLSADSAIMFYTLNGLISVLFLRMAMRWPELCRDVAKIEYVHPSENSWLSFKCTVTCLIVVVVGALEHSLSDLSGMSLAQACQKGGNPYEAFLKQNFHWFWGMVPYNLFLGILLKWFNIQCTFNWNYSDAFIMCMCFYLLARFQQINDKIESARGQVVPSSFWRTMREDYTKATRLVRRFDDVISGVIFVSFASNLFSICFLILHILDEGIIPTTSCYINNDTRKLEGMVYPLYFIVSISFLLLRSIAVALVAAKVHNASIEPSFALYEVPSDGYCVEVQRFLEQVHGDSVVLSGLRFFSVKRGMVLTIAATIVTYELVLIQFAGVTTSPTTAPSIRSAAT